MQGALGWMLQRAWDNWCCLPQGAQEGAGGSRGLFELRKKMRAELREEVVEEVRRAMGVRQLMIEELHTAQAELAQERAPNPNPNRAVPLYSNIGLSALFQSS